MASPPAPLLWFLLVLLKGALRLPQEINIPNITFSQLGGQGSSWETCKRGGACLFSGTRVRIFSPGDPRNLFQTNKTPAGKPGSQEPREASAALGSRTGSAKAGVAGTGHHCSACPWQQLGVGRCGQDCPIVQMRKAEAQRGDVTVPRPEPSLSSKRCFPNSCHPPLGLRLIWEYSESYGPFAVKSGYRHLHANVVCNFREVKFSLKDLDKNPYQPSKCICLHTPSPSQAWALGEAGEGHWSPLPAP